MLATMTSIVMFGLAVSMALCAYRLLRGPAVVDRLLAVDTIATNLLAFLIVLSIDQRTDVYLDSVIVLALLAFVGTVAVAKALVWGKIID